MGNSNLGLKLIFGILIIVFIGEVGYLVYTNKFAPAPAKNNQDIVSPEPTIDIKLPRQVNDKSMQAINQTVLEDLAKINREVITSSDLENNFFGTIVNISRDNGLKIRINSGKYYNSFTYSELELYVIKVLRHNPNGDPIPDSIENLKIGQQIYIKAKIDLLEDLTKNLKEVTMIYVPQNEKN